LATDKPVIVNDLVNDPRYLAYKFNFDTETVSFLPIESGEIRRVTSLDRRDFDSSRQFLEAPLAELVDLANASNEELQARPPRFIFHTAFCSSTFLSRCLDVEGVTVGIREPQLLLDAANAKRLQWRSRTTKLEFKHMPGLALKLLQKHASATETLVIKPINSVNNIISELLQITGSAKSLMLYTDARNFALSTLRKREGGKQTVRSMFDLLRCDFPHLAGLQLTHTIHMTDLRVIMTLWRLQIEQAKQALQQFAPGNRMASVYGEELIRNPLQSIEAANRFLELGISSEQIRTIVSSGETAVDAKNRDKQFSFEKRQKQYEPLEHFYGDDLDDGLEWLVRNNPGTELHPALSGALEVG